MFEFLSVLCDLHIGGFSSTSIFTNQSRTRKKQEAPIFYGRGERETDRESNNFRSSLCVERLQTKWRWCSIGKTHMLGNRREFESKQFLSGKVRLLRGMWLWAQSFSQWEDCQQCARTNGCTAGPGHERKSLTRKRNHFDKRFIISILIVTALSLDQLVHGFFTPKATITSYKCICGRDLIDGYDWKVTSALNNYDDLDGIETFGEGDLDGVQEHDAMFEDLYWRVEKLRLEEQNTRRFLKSKPRFLPYDECRKWVQAFGRRWVSEDEWKEWINMGEKKNPYIPSRPDEYYSSIGCWINWDHFLLPEYDIFPGNSSVT